jgi:hypothetical protein
MTGPPDGTDYTAPGAGLSSLAFPEPMPAVLHVLPANRSLAYRLGETIAVAAGGVFAGVTALAVASALILTLPYVFNGSILPLLQTAILLAGIFASIIAFSAIHVSFAEIGRDAELEITADGILRFDDFNGCAKISLSGIGEVRAGQSIFGDLFGYGTIEIFASASSEPLIVIAGVNSPDTFKDRLETILKRYEPKPRAAQTLAIAAGASHGPDEEDRREEG